MIRTWSLEWLTAVAPVASAAASVVLVLVTYRYVRLTRALVRSQIHVELKAELDVYRLDLRDQELSVRLSPDRVRITNIRSPVIIHSVVFDSTGRPTGDRRVPGGMREPLRIIERPTPAQLLRGETMFCDFGEDAGVWTLGERQNEVVVRVVFSVMNDRKRATYVCVAPLREPTDPGPPITGQ